jgi:hypothetical protein
MEEVHYVQHSTDYRTFNVYYYFPLFENAQTIIPLIRTLNMHTRYIQLADRQQNFSDCIFHNLNLNFQ